MRPPLPPSHQRMRTSIIMKPNHQQRGGANTTTTTTVPLPPIILSMKIFIIKCIRSTAETSHHQCPPSLHPSRIPMIIAIIA